MGLRIFETDADHTLAAWRNVLMMHWHGPVTMDAVQATHPAHDAVYAEYPRGLGVFVIVSDSTPIPPTEVRQVSALIIRATAGEVLCQCTIIEGGGFWGSAARSAAAAINILSRPPNPTRVFGEVEEAVAWQTPFLNYAGYSQEEFAAAARDLRAISETATANVGT